MFVVIVNMVTDHPAWIVSSSRYSTVQTHWFRDVTSYASCQSAAGSWGKLSLWVGVSLKNELRSCATEGHWSVGLLCGDEPWWHCSEDRLINGSWGVLHYGVVSMVPMHPPRQPTWKSPIGQWSSDPNFYSFSGLRFHGNFQRWTASLGTVPYMNNHSEGSQ